MDFNFQSEADKELKESLELMVERVGDVSPQIQLNALEMLRDKIRTSTSSMTAVPKPLKFLSPLYPKLQANFEVTIQVHVVAVIMRFHSELFYDDRYYCHVCVFEVFFVVVIICFVYLFVCFLFF